MAEFCSSFDDFIGRLKELLTPLFSQMFKVPELRSYLQQQSQHNINEIQDIRLLLKVLHEFPKLNHYFSTNIHTIRFRLNMANELFNVHAHQGEECEYLFVRVSCHVCFSSFDRSCQLS
jgi:hypothetical protein